MNRSHVCILFLSALVLCAVVVPLVSAAKATPVPTTKATVPPILQACSHAVYPNASFTCTYPINLSGDVTEGPPYNIECTDLSFSEPGQAIGIWSWEFGDGGSSALQRPVHAYNESGKYTVRLTVTTLCGRQYSNTTTGMVSVFCNVPEPGFTTNVTGGTAPLVVQVTDTSRNSPAGITTWTYWLDNSAVSNEQNPLFTFSEPGTYTISQTVWKDCVQPGSIPKSPVARVIVVSPPSAVIPVNVSGTPVVVTEVVPLATTETPVPMVTPVVTEVVMTERPETGTLSVITDPSGVQVFVDDVLRGTSPVMVGLQEGSHMVRLEKEGYNSTTAPVLVTPGKTTEYSHTLVPLSGGIALVPVIALVVIIVLVIGAAIVLYRRRQEEE